jgi:hypothetical protein
MPMIWPPRLKPTNVSFRLDSPSRSGGQSVLGNEQIVVSGAGRWKATVDLVLRKEEDILSCRALLAQLQGRAGEVLVPAFDGFRPRDAEGQMFNDKIVAPLSDTALFDLTGFGQTIAPAATLAADAAINATDIAVDLADGEGPRPGQYVGIGERLYIARFVWKDTADGQTNIRLFPKLRAPASSGSAVILDKPVCTMRLASDDSGAMTLNLRRFSSVTLEFIEAF